MPVAKPELFRLEPLAGGLVAEAFLWVWVATVKRWRAYPVVRPALITQLFVGSPRQGR